MPLCSSFQYGGLQSLPIDTLLRKRSMEIVPSVPSVWECCAKLICIRFTVQSSKEYCSHLGIRTPRSDALQMSHQDSTVIEVYYEFGEEILQKLNFDHPMEQNLHV